MRTSRSTESGEAATGRSNAACSTTLTTSLQSFGASSSWWQWETAGGVTSQATAQTAKIATESANTTAWKRGICTLL